MKLKLYSLRCLEIFAQKEEDIKVYVNSISLNNKVLLIREDISQNLRDFLESKKINYLASKDISLNSLSKNKDDLKEFKEENKKQEEVKKKIYTKPVRSGQEIECKVESIFLKRVNVGAKIKSKFSLEFFSLIDGDIICDGDYIILKNIAKGSVRFMGEELKKEDFKDEKLKLLRYVKGEFVLIDLE